MAHRGSRAEVGGAPKSPLASVGLILQRGGEGNVAAAGSAGGGSGNPMDSPGTGTALEDSASSNLTSFVGGGASLIIPLEKFQMTMDNPQIATVAEIEEDSFVAEDDEIEEMELQLQTMQAQLESELSAIQTSLTMVEQNDRKISELQSQWSKLCSHSEAELSQLRQATADSEAELAVLKEREMELDHEVGDREVEYEAITVKVSQERAALRHHFCSAVAEGANVEQVFAEEDGYADAYEAFERTIHADSMSTLPTPTARTSPTSRTSSVVAASVRRPPPALKKDEFTTAGRRKPSILSAGSTPVSTSRSPSVAFDLSSSRNADMLRMVMSPSASASGSGGGPTPTVATGTGTAGTFDSGVRSPSDSPLKNASDRPLFSGVSSQSRSGSDANTSLSFLVAPASSSTSVPSIFGASRSGTGTEMGPPKLTTFEVTKTVLGSAAADDTNSSSSASNPTPGSASMTPPSQRLGKEQCSNTPPPPVQLPFFGSSTTSQYGQQSSSAAILSPSPPPPAVVQDRSWLPKVVTPPSAEHLASKASGRMKAAALRSVGPATARQKSSAVLQQK